MNESWIDHEFKNWARWANSGPMPGPSLGVDPVCFYDEDDSPVPIYEEHAKLVQTVFDVSAFIERKVMQAEYLSPWKYGRNTGIHAAARALKISPPSYETILCAVKRRVEQVFS
jgi:hypothetical protein